MKYIKIQLLSFVSIITALPGQYPASYDKEVAVASAHQTQNNAADQNGAQNNAYIAPATTTESYDEPVGVVEKGAENADQNGAVHDNAYGNNVAYVAATTTESYGETQAPVGAEVTPYVANDAAQNATPPPQVYAEPVVDDANAGGTYGKGVAEVEKGVEVEKGYEAPAKGVENADQNQNQNAEKNQNTDVAEGVEVEKGGEYVEPVKAVENADQTQTQNAEQNQNQNAEQNQNQNAEQNTDQIAGESAGKGEYAGGAEDTKSTGDADAGKLEVTGDKLLSTTKSNGFANVVSFVAITLCCLLS